MDTYLTTGKANYVSYLSQEETLNPMSFIEEFFSVDWLPGHLATLKEWRLFVIGDAYYTDEQDNPSNLLYIHRLTLQLLEAAFLLMQSNKNRTVIEYSETEKAEQLERYREAWACYPAWLSADEILDPNSAFESIFSKYDLPAYKEQLGEWLRSGLSCYGIGTDLTAEQIITVYDNLQKLYEVCWVLLHKDKIVSDTATEDPERSVEIPADNPTNVFTNAIDFLIENLQPEKVFYLSHGAVDPAPDEREQATLIVILPDKNQIPFKDLEPVIELTFAIFPTIFVHLVKSCALKDYLLAGHLFYSFACTTQNLLFDDGLVKLPVIAPGKLKKLLHSAKAEFEKLFAKAHRFKVVAHLEKDSDKVDNGFVLYLLQQATELAFRAVILSLFGHDPHTHSIKNLEKQNQFCLPQLNRIFPANNDEENQLLQLMTDAYINGRYSAHFIVSDTQLGLYFERVNDLHERAVVLFRGKIEAFERIIAE